MQAAFRKNCIVFPGTDNKIRVACVETTWNFKKTSKNMCFTNYEEWILTRTMNLKIEIYLCRHCTFALNRIFEEIICYWMSLTVYYSWKMYLLYKLVEFLNNIAKLGRNVCLSVANSTYRKRNCIGKSCRYLVFAT